MEASVGTLWVPASLEALLLVMAGGFAVLWLILLRARRGADRARRMVFLAFISLLGLLLGRAWFVEPFYVPSASMVPTIHVGDTLLVQKFPYRLYWPISGKALIQVGTPKRGDVIVFTLVDKPDVRYVKRVIGLPGDNVIAWKGRWFVNGKELEQQPQGVFSGNEQGPGLDGKKAFQERLAGRQYGVMEDRELPAQSWQVPAEHLFVLGDNRGMSRDSREFGFVEESRVLGRVARVLWNTQNSGGFLIPVGSAQPLRLH